MESAERIMAAAAKQQAQVAISLTPKQARKLVSLHDQLAQVYRGIPHCGQVAANHRKEARTIEKMFKAAMARKDAR